MVLVRNSDSASAEAEEGGIVKFLFTLSESVVK